MKILVKNAKVVSAREVLEKDIYIEDGKFCEAFQGEADKVIDAGGKFMLPGAIDVHTHVEQESDVDKTCDDYFEGTRAAVSGGTTMVVMFAVQRKGVLPLTLLKDRMASAKSKAVCDFSFHLQLTDITEETLAQLEEVVKMGISSVKIYMAGAGFTICNTNIVRLMELSKKLGFLIEVHAESDELVQFYREDLVKEGKTQMQYYAPSRPLICETAALSQLSAYAKALGCKVYIVHLTSKEGLEICKNSEGRLIVETCPHYLTFTSDIYEKEGPRAIQSPPVREAEDRDALWKGILEGDVKTVGSDHCPFYLEEKQLDDFSKVPLGTPGMETLLPVVFSEGVSKGRIPVTKVAEVLSENPAKIFNLENKGKIAPGYDADFVLLDPKEDYVMTDDKAVTTAGYSTFSGITFHGKVKETYVRGQLVYADNELKVEKGFGTFQARKPVQTAV